MSIFLHSKEALLAAAANATLPVSIVVGAPLSSDADGGVPVVDGMIDLVRSEIESRIPTYLPTFEHALAGRSGGDAYQAAMEWLQGNLTQDGVNRVVRRAVLTARRQTFTSEFKYDGEPSEWYIPAGTAQLADLVCRSEQFPGPIITTNFDPLISLAIRKNGGRVERRLFDNDGALQRKAEGDTTAIEIAHLHGYWRDADTLHTPAQLQSIRKKLRASLQNLLRSHTILVVAYGGWHDSFTDALSELLVDDAAKCTILWCFREVDGAEVERKYKHLFEKFESAITRGRFTAYGGIDCHKIFGELVASSATTKASPSLTNSPLIKWELIDKDYLKTLRPLDMQEVHRFFDGAWPTWRHAISPKIPHRCATTRVIRVLDDDRNHGDCNLQLITAAGGEGKSTVLLQAAVHAVRSGKWKVLWRPNLRIPLVVEQVLSLDTSTLWLIVSDDAQTILEEINTISFELHEQGRTNIFFLLAARDTDWRTAGGFEIPWETRLNVRPNIVLRGIADDAIAIVNAWTSAGALRRLESIPDTNHRAAALVRAASEDDSKGADRSFYGALLQTRFDEDSLTAHAREMLGHLRKMNLESGATLFDAIVCVSALHAVDVPGLHPAVLAQVVGMPWEWVHARVIRRLGEEASAAAAGARIYTRHKSVAIAILVEAEAKFGVDLGEIWSAIVRATVAQKGFVREDDPSYLRTVHIGPRLPRKLPKKISKARRVDIALAAAKASVSSITNRLDCLVDLATVYRIRKDIDKASDIFRDHHRTAKNYSDYEFSVRGFWNEWGVCEGNRADSAVGVDAILQGRSLSDSLKPAPFSAQRTAISCAGLGAAFKKMGAASSNCPFQRARRAVAFLGLFTEPDQGTRKKLLIHDEEAAAFGATLPTQIPEALGTLADALRLAQRKVRDPFFIELIQAETFEFDSLEQFLDEYHEKYDQI